MVHFLAVRKPLVVSQRPSCVEVGPLMTARFGEVR